jgi:hypothetical protein
LNLSTIFLLLKSADIFPLKWIARRFSLPYPQS